MEDRALYGDLGMRGASADFEEVFEQNKDAFDGMDIVRRLFKVQSTQKSLVRDVGITGYDLLEDTAEGDDFPEDMDHLTYVTQYHARDLTKRVVVTHNAIEDHTYAPALDKFAGFSRSTGYTLGKKAMNVLNSAFVSTLKPNGYFVERYGDAKNLASVSHPRKDGGTAQSNASATNIALTELNLETGRLALVKQATDIGLPMINAGGITLVVPDDLEKDAVIITGSQKRATTAENDLNFYLGRINVISSRWLDSEFTATGGSGTKWHLVSNMSKLKLYIRQEPRFRESVDGKNWNMTFSVKMRAAAGFSGWQGTWHSQGTATGSYSS
jgi:hypothetical protein